MTRRIAISSSARYSVKLMSSDFNVVIFSSPVICSRFVWSFRFSFCSLSSFGSVSVLFGVRNW